MHSRFICNRRGWSSFFHARGFGAAPVLCPGLDWEGNPKSAARLKRPRDTPELSHIRIGCAGQPCLVGVVAHSPAAMKAVYRGPSKGLLNSYDFTIRLGIRFSLSLPGVCKTSMSFFAGGSLRGASFFGISKKAAPLGPPEADLAWIFHKKAPLFP
jgi:hypothetical protein